MDKRTILKFFMVYSFKASNYFAEVDSELCTGCGTCLERYQMNALSLIDDFSTINLDHCFGCGACVPTCPSEAIQLRKKKRKLYYQKTGMRYMSKL